MTLTLRSKSSNSTSTSHFSLSLSKSKSLSLSRTRRRANTLSPSSSSSAATTELETLELSLLLDTKPIKPTIEETLIIPQEEEQKPLGGKIKFVINDIPESDAKVSSKLVKGRKKYMTEVNNNPQDLLLDLTKSNMNRDHNQLLPSPLIKTTFPKSPYPFPPTPPTLLPLPSSRDKKYSHRRSRSFSELITSSSSISQPWRDRDTWLAMNAAKPPIIPQRKGSIPADLTQGGWRGKGGGTFFGADMNSPIPGNKVRVKPISPPTSPSRSYRFNHKKDGEIVHHENEIITFTQSPASTMECSPQSLNELIDQHKSDSSWNVMDVSPASSEEGHTTSKKTRYHTTFEEEYDDDDDLLPPLLPRTITRASSFSSTSRNTTPIPWAQRSGNISPGNKTPTSSLPRTPSRQAKCPTSSPLGDNTPKTWMQVHPSPPKTERKIISPLMTPRTPGSPTKGALRNGFRPQRRSTSPLPLTPPSTEDDGKSVKSPGKKFWKSLKLGSPSKGGERRVGFRRPSFDQGETSPIKKIGWF
ncbi:uncharacterized protein IL334_003269 [Kwoniella shivajii]|uniref:Uncharacterized protein n=1 Tax=Kwoniella shivajii TaxID=564305 RepID=A0ABZ1CYD2_9TREE|nr:hypothetical protein IL334_003269 [Kwoniella shivajii]